MRGSPHAPPLSLAPAAGARLRALVASACRRATPRRGGAGGGSFSVFWPFDFFADDAPPRSSRACCRRRAATSATPPRTSRRRWWATPPRCETAVGCPFALPATTLGPRCFRSLVCADSARAVCPLRAQDLVSEQTAPAKKAKATKPKSTKPRVAKPAKEFRAGERSSDRAKARSCELNGLPLPAVHFESCCTAARCVLSTTLPQHLLKPLSRALRCAARPPRLHRPQTKPVEIYQIVDTKAKKGARAPSRAARHAVAAAALLLRCWLSQPGSQRPPCRWLLVFVVCCFSFFLFLTCSSPSRLSSAFDFSLEAEGREEGEGCRPQGEGRLHQQEGYYW